MSLIDNPDKPNLMVLPNCVQERPGSTLKDVPYNWRPGRGRRRARQQQDSAYQKCVYIHINSEFILKKLSKKSYLTRADLWIPIGIRPLY